MNPEDVAQIDAALHAHAQWFIKLRMAIDKGSSEFKPEIVKTDNACAFGKWLYGNFPAKQKETTLYKEIKDLHANFHAEAGKVLELAIGNQKNVALKAVEAGSPLRQISSILVKKLNQLKTAV